MIKVKRKREEKKLIHVQSKKPYDLLKGGYNHPMEHVHTSDLMLPEN